MEVRDLVKKYQLYSSEKDRLKEAFHPFHKSYHRDYYALNGVSFKVEKGEKVGIIGSNGAGKSTILKIITGVLNQTSGDIRTEGRIAALLELGAGFNQDYTGIENIRLNGTLMGYSEAEIEERMQRIVDFADIGDFVNQPVKTYSSGMFVRLAFATQIFSEPDILIVDEALSVGDIRFQQKCYRAMEELMKDKTVLLVTHDTSAVTKFCQRVIWLDHGEKVYDGEVVEGLRRYKEHLINRAIEERGEKINEDYRVSDAPASREERVAVTRGVPPVPENIRPKGTGQAVIYEAGIFRGGELTGVLEPGDEVEFVVRAEFLQRIEHPIIGLAIRDRLGNDIIGINSQTLNVELAPAEGKEEYCLKMVLPEINRGEYVVTVAIANGYQNDHVQLCWLDDLLVFRVPPRDYDIPGFIYMTRGDVTVSGLD